MKKKLLLLITLVFLCSLLPVSAQKTMVKTTKTPAVKTNTAVQKNLSPVAGQITCKIGAPGLGGGTVFFENPNYSKDGYRYLEAFWADESCRIPYSKTAAFLKEFNSGKGKIGELNTLKKSDWYIPSEAELNSLVSVLGYPKGLLPPGSYFVSGGAKTVSFDYDIKTKNRTLNKVPERLSGSKTLKTKNLKTLNPAKLKTLETKKVSLNIANLVLVRKIRNEELKREKPKFNLTLSQVSGRSSQSSNTSAQSSASANQSAQTNTFVSSSSNVDRYNYSSIDNYVLNLSIPDTMSLEEVAGKICQTARNEKEKARAIYIWICANISYDADSLNLSEADQTEIGIRDADKTFERRMGICTGFALLYSKMAKAVGLEAEDLGGYAITCSYSYGDAIDTAENAHAWNRVKAGNESILLDVTWGANYSQFGSSIPDINEAWFDCDKELFAMTHYPCELRSTTRNIIRPIVDAPENQSITKPLNREMFKATPYISPALAFSGIKGTDVLNFLKTHPKAWSMYIFTGLESVVKDGLKINKLEFSDEIATNKKAVFNFSFPNGKGVYIYFNGVEIGEAQNGKDLELSFDEPGQLIFRYGPPKGTITGFIRYNVVASSVSHTQRENAIKTAFASY